MSVGQSLIVELEAIEGGSKEKRVDSFRRVTDLFVADADRLTDQQIEVFDDILDASRRSDQGSSRAQPPSGADPQRSDRSGAPARPR